MVCLPISCFITDNFMKTIKLNETMNEITEIISIAKFAAAYKLLKQAM